MLIPFGARVIVKPHDVHVQKLKSGIYAAKDHDVHPVTGHVVSVGAGPWTIKEPPRVGQAIVFKRMAAKHHAYLGQTYYILKEDELFAYYPNETIPDDLN